MRTRSSSQLSKAMSPPPVVCGQALSPTQLPRDASTRSGRLWAEEKLGAGLDPAQVFEAGLACHHLANTAYPIAHRRTIWPFRRPAADHRRLLSEGFGSHMGLYIHLPFCERRCAFCEYTVVKQHSEQVEQAYHEALLKELSLYNELLGGEQKQLVGLDFGGGTPALVSPARIGELVEQATRSFSLAPGFGMSIETTPRIAALFPERIRALRACGIERISMGLQTVSPRLLARYGRDFIGCTRNAQAVQNIRQAGFDRLNIDLMYGFAGQSVKELVASIEHALSLQPEYITLYRMRYKGTQVSREAREVELERVVQMYEAAYQLLASAGYPANPGKNGFSRVAGDPGTSAYLTQRVVWSTPYLGLGLGAQTFTNTLLAYNLGAATKRTERYLAAVAAGELPVQDLYHLPPSEAMAKMISVAFYFGEINLLAFSMRFGRTLQQVFPAEVRFVLQRGLMERCGQVLRLTRAGVRAFNGVVALFYSDRVKTYLLEIAARR